MPSKLDRARLAPLLEAETLERLSTEQIFALVGKDEQLASYAPDATYQVDPRDGRVIIYNSARARRPHEYDVPEAVAEAADCPICQGNTTGVLDVADLSEGFTFINKNLFPVLHVHELPDPAQRAPQPAEPLTAQGGPSYGLHLLQWTSSRHDLDWHNMPQADRVVVMRRLAALERKLLFGAAGLMPPAEPWHAAQDVAARGYVSIIKNYGGLVGGSLPHGHQQIAFSNVMPRRMRDNHAFLQRHGEPFAAYLLRENPRELLVKDYGPAVLVVPYCMQRPYSMLLLLKDVTRQYLCELDAAELTAVADGWHDAIRAIHQIMPRIGKELAYNVVVANGPGAGLHVEFLPYTQEMGGFEHLGLWVCQGKPADAASQLRAILA